MAQYDFSDAIPFNGHPIYKKGYEDAVDKACEWLEDNCKGYFMCDKVQVYNLTDALRKAMEE